MKRFKEKFKAIYHIIIDSEYIVFTMTRTRKGMTSGSCLISDNIGRITLESAIEVLDDQEGTEYE